MFKCPSVCFSKIKRIKTIVFVVKISLKTSGRVHEIISGGCYTERGHKLIRLKFFSKKIEPEKLFNEDIGNKKPLPAPYLKV